MTETSSLTNAGLFTRGGAVAPVPLTGVSIDAEISGLCASVAVAHRYENREDQPVEAVYVFPLPEGAAVCGFEAIVDGTLVVGEVREREEAFEEYDRAMEEGHGAFLLDEQRPDVFQASVGNLPPGKDVLVRISYVTELTVDDGRLRFVIPTTVSPRYAPAEDQAGIGQPDSEALNPPVAWTVPFGLDLAVRIAMPGGIRKVESPSHPVSVELADDGTVVTLAQPQAALDRDFVLSVDAAGAGVPQAWIERTVDGGEAVAVAFVPQFAPEPSPAEIIFIVDRSGSMQGTSIDEVRKALQLCLRSMITGCRFNIVGFGSSHEALFPESRPYDQTSLAEASAHAAALDADLGGTEILPALAFVLDRPCHGGLARQLVVLTDGEVTNTDAVLALVRQHAAAARVFPVGIGAGASHHLVRGLARAGRGSAEFIYPGERIEPKVVRLFGRLLSPAMTDVTLEWKGGRVVQAPLDVPPVFAGSRLLLYGFAAAGDRPNAVRLSASTPSGPFSCEVPLDAAPIVRGRAVATLAARARLRELEEGGEWLTARGSRQKARKESGVRKEIVDLSVRYGLISRETSFVAIERRETPVHGDVQLRRVPVALTSGWGGLETNARPWMMRMPLPAAKSVHMGRMTLGGSAPPWSAFDDQAAPLATEARSLPAPARLEAFSADVQPTPARRRAFVAQPPAGLAELVALQKADGSWDLTADLAAILGVSLPDLDAALAGSSGSRDDARRAWATALALAWLQANAREVEGEWQMLGTKARKWLDDISAVPPGGWTWVDAARRFLAPR